MARSGGGGGGGRDMRSPMPMPTPGARTGPRQFVSESVGELRKVQWPGPRHTAVATMVVGTFTLFFAIYLTIVDAAVAPFINFLMGRG